jgi:hypothetical protein
LQRVLPRRSDWVWILDHTIRLGQHKCLLILGVSLERLRSSRDPLGHHDVVVLDLWVSAHCTGEDVEDRLCNLAKRVGEPRQIVSDHGSDLRKGIGLFQAEHPGVVDTYDVTHRMACLLKAELGQDERWLEFLRCCTSSLRKLHQTRGSFLVPPAPRSLARYMNVDRHINWACRALSVLEWRNGAEVAGLLGMGEEAARAWVTEKLGWLQGFREDVGRYQRLLSVVRSTEEVVKNHGLGRGTSMQVWQGLAPEVLEDASLNAFLRKVRSYLEEEGSKIPARQRWLGSSDVIESVFGKYKWLGEKGPYAEVSASVLTLPLLTTELTPELIREALTTVSMDDVRAWVAENVGPSTLAKVRGLTAAVAESDPPSVQDTKPA